MPPGVFISYSHEDERWKKRLAQQLGVLEREGLVHAWHDGLIAAGGDWLKEIERAMAEARVAVLLVTAAFLSSDFIRAREVPELLERRQREGLQVIPVFVKPCNWQVSPLGSIQGRPANGKALSTLPASKADEELTKIAREILELVRGKLPSGRTDLPVEAVAGTFPRLHQLPTAPADFTGRECDLEALRRSAAAAGGAGAILGVFGMGGVGKTTLALKLAEEISPQYPDGQIYLDLKGVTTPLSPAQAMAHVARSFHPEASLPADETELAAHYQSILHSKRALLFLDNAAGREQVEPLLPPRGCALLVTSRFHFMLPGLTVHDLDELPAEDACALLLRISSRIAEAAAELARLCGRLPLALRLAGSAMAERPDLAPDAYARRLAEGRERLGPVDASLRASYDLLPAEHRRLWRLLAVFPGTFDAAAAAAIWQMEGATAEDKLGKLVTSSLVEWEESLSRYRFHDLARSFAEHQLLEAERDEAGRRHATHYLGVLRRADSLYEQGGDGILRGLALLDAEWSNVQAGQEWAAARPPEDAEAAAICDAYPSAGFFCLAVRLSPRVRIRWCEAALAAARQRQDRQREAGHLGNLGIAYFSLGESRRAIEFHEQSLAIAREIGDLSGEGSELGNLGTAYASVGETHRAIECHERNLTIAREAGDRRQEGAALGNLGLAHGGLGETHRAIELYKQSLTIERDIGDRRAEAGTLGNLGNAYDVLGDAKQAIELYQQQLAIARETGDRWSEATASWNLGLMFHAAGDLARAADLLQVMVDLERETGHADAEKDAAHVRDLRAKVLAGGAPKRSPQKKLRQRPPA
jgi:tetratricopeptide (TPR) repeat protein